MRYVVPVAWVFAVGLASLSACALADDDAPPAKPKQAAANQDKKKPDKITLADGKLELAVPDTWVRKQPQTRIIEHEFAVPASEGDKADGRVTVMGAGGSVEANILRWHGQFDDKSKAKTTKMKVAGMDIHVVDISGAFRDQRGPMAPAEVKKGYRMLAAIVVTDKLGQYFVKLTGPEKTVADGEKAFLKMLASLTEK